MQGKIRLGKIRKDWKRNYPYYLLLLPVLLYYLIFLYVPMGGLVMAFQKFNIAKGVFGSEWTGFANILSFFNSYYFVRLLRNTVFLSLLSLVFGVVGPVGLALLLNEVGNKIFKKTIQTATYIPYFISLVVVASLVKIFVAPEGPIGALANTLFGLDKNLLTYPEFFRGIMVTSDLWQMTGYICVIYLAALSGIEHEQYEAARIDGAGHWKQLLHVTIPGIAPTIIVLFIMRTGQLLNVGYEKILLLYGPGIYETADVISTFVYRKGLMQADYGYATAVGLFNSIAGLLMVLLSNWLAKRYTETRLF
jgi:putative aldouronate transport system permease protein